MTRTSHRFPFRSRHIKGHEPDFAPASAQKLHTLRLHLNEDLQQGLGSPPPCPLPSRLSFPSFSLYISLLTAGCGALLVVSFWPYYVFPPAQLSSNMQGQGKSESSLPSSPDHLLLACWPWSEVAFFPWYPFSSSASASPFACLMSSQKAQEDDVKSKCALSVAAHRAVS